MTEDTPAELRTHPIFGGLRFRIRSEGPWAARKGEADAFGAFRRYVGEPKGGPLLHQLELTTELSLRVAESAGQLAELWQEAADWLEGQSPSQVAERATAVVQTLQAHVDQIMRPIAAMVSRPRPVDHQPLFAAAAAAPLMLLGVSYDSAHAAAGAAPRVMCDVWDVVRELAAEAGALEEALVLHLLGQAIEQLPGSDFRLILQQIAWEHLAVRAAKEQAGSAPKKDERQSDALGARWSKSYSKSQLAGFFGETIKTLDAYLERTGIRFQAVSRQSFIINMNSLHADVRERFLRELEARK